MAAEFNLHGFWYSPFTLRVVWALKLKGIPYNNIEEDRYNKSPQLLEYNPVYKKTPVLVHGGKPICESLIIVEYLDEISPHNPLLPSDSYDRAQSHFWVKYADEVFPAFSALFRSNGGEEREKAIVNIWEHLRVVEEHYFGEDNKILGGDNISIVDLAFGSLINIIAALDDIIQVKVLEPQKFPLLLSWFDNFKNIPIINENLPNHDKMVDSIKSIREKLLVS